MRFRMPMQSAFAPPLGDGSCVTAIPKPRGERTRATGALVKAAGPWTGEIASDERLFMDCINLEMIRTKVRMAVPRPCVAYVFPTPLGIGGNGSTRAGPAGRALAKPTGIGNQNPDLAAERANCAGPLLGGGGIASVMLTLLAVLAAPLVYLSAPPAWGMTRRVRGPDYVVRIPLPSARAQIGLPPIEGAADASRPLVVIDAGHGGYDPGASGADGLKESALTLALARALRDELVNRARVRVALTRDGDRFLALEERAGIAHRMKADLFISIHADAAADPSARGATIYTLSERASDTEAARIAARENRADMVNGVALGQQRGDVAAILLDLSRRATLERSSLLAGLVLREARGALRFRPEPLKSAAFVVLKSADVPSVLFEAGYISNADDASRLLGTQAQAGFAGSFARAIDAYFARVRRS
jgi:N-acetylmuramoyl-L-alanine amidase